jgi:hypothetical protein
VSLTRQSQTNEPRWKTLKDGVGRFPAKGQRKGEPRETGKGSLISGIQPSISLRLRRLMFASLAKGRKWSKTALRIHVYSINLNFSFQAPTANTVTGFGWDRPVIDGVPIGVGSAVFKRAIAPTPTVIDYMIKNDEDQPEALAKRGPHCDKNDILEFLHVVAAA